jgi:hypothetical protein
MILGINFFLINFFFPKIMIDLYIENKSINQIYRDLTLKEEIIRKKI